VVTDLAGRTDIPGLYAVGETACTGLHGANRLASNSLLECLVVGRACAHQIASALPAELPPEAGAAAGTRFMPAHDERGELAPRDVVARAISAEIARGGRVFLDARRALGTRFGARFPAIAALCHEAGIDPGSAPIPVRPAVHYHMGGIATDRGGRTSVPGLWVAGEAASTGLHGANRLASNSLLEAAVMGMRAARDMASSAIKASLGAVPALPPDPETSLVRPIVSRHLGVLRNAGAIHGAIASLLPLAESEGPASDPAIVALSISVFASLRQESRGAHARTDFPLRQGVARRRMMTLAEVLEIARAAASQDFARSA
jgi:L-aspartate oxidase